MNLYFLAILPPEHIQTEIKHLKEELRDRFGSEHALKLPAHITLIPPFKISEDAAISMMQSLEGFSSNQIPFHLRLSGFGSFAPRVLFVDVIEKEKVNALYKDLVTSLSGFLEKYANETFYSHLTLATRDLERTIFPDALKFLKDRDYETRFEVNAIYLLSHKGKKWEIEIEFKFGKS